MKRLLTFIFFLVMLAQAHAQQRSITGVVRDSKGEPVPFATVTVTGTPWLSTQAMANCDGLQPF